jgi:hypothetical protein
MLRAIRQQHGDGCFISVIATLLEIPYEKAFQRVYPGREMPPTDDNGYYNWTLGMTPEKSLELMPSLGLELIPTKMKSVMSLRKGRTALILLRWRSMPTLLHGIVYDGETGRFLDPGRLSYIKTRKAMQENLESIYYVKRTQTSRRTKNESRV